MKKTSTEALMLWELKKYGLDINDKEIEDESTQRYMLREIANIWNRNKKKFVPSYRSKGNEFNLATETDINDLIDGDSFLYCQKCHNLLLTDQMEYCPYCGQKIDWSFFQQYYNYHYDIRSRFIFDDYYTIRKLNKYAERYKNSNDIYEQKMYRNICTVLENTSKSGFVEMF